MQTISSSQASAEVPINENFAGLQHQEVYAKKPTTSTGLTWGYWGGRWGGILISDGTLALTGSATNYIVQLRSSGALSVSTSATNWNNPALYARVYKLTTSSTAVTATEDHRAGNLGVHGGMSIAAIPIACSDEVTALTTGTAKVTFRMPFALTLTDVRASVTTAPTGGTLLTVDVNDSGTTILSTKLTFDASEKTTTTAATPRVISDTALADDAEITIDIDAVGSTVAGAGLKVYLIGYPT